MKTNRYSMFLRMTALLGAVLCAGVVRAAPGDVLYAEPFETGGGSCTMGAWNDDPGPGWRAGVNQDTSDTAPCSLFTQGDDVTVTGPVVDTAVPAAQLEVWVRRGDDSFSENPDGGDDLALQYLDNGASWVTLETFPGSGTNGEILDRIYTLPAAARHSGFRVRVVATGADGNGFDYWHIDTVRVVESQPPFIGTGTGLTGAYCNRDTSNETVPCDSSPDVTRVDATVDFSNGDAGWPAPGIGGDTFSVRWTGQIQAQFTEDYRIHTISDDGIRVWIDGSLVIDNYTDHAATEDISAQIALTRGTKYDIVIEYYENGGQQDARLLWSSPSTAPVGSPVVVPQTQLYPTAGVSANLLADWRMDEASWSGSSGEVTDSTGNGRDGTAQGGAQTDDTSAAIAGDPGTCGYGTFDGNDDYVEVSGLSGILNGTATLTFWIRTTQTGNDTGWMAPGVTGVEEAGGADDIFWGWLDGSGRIGINVGDDFGAAQKSSSAINDGNWHHVALTRDASSGATKIYVDGSLETTGSTGTGTIGNGFTSIGRIEDTGGSPEYFQGDLDEVRVYDDVLSDSDVSAVFSATHPCAPGGPVAWYQLDESAYGGAPGEVLDATGNGNDGSTVGNVSSYPDTDADAQVCSGAIVADNTSSGVQDAIDTGVDVDGALGDSGSINFWFWSPTRWRQLSADRMLLDASNPGASGGAKYFYLMLTDATSAGGPSNRGARLNFGLEDDNDGDWRFETDRIDIDRDTWVHIGITWDMASKEMQVYVDGALEDSWNIGGATNQLGDMDSLYLGDNRSGYLPNPMTGNSANGRFDEVRLYDTVIDAAQMAADRNATHPCGAGLDHYAVGHDGTAITCGAEPVTITAHDSGHNPLDPGNVSIGLTTSSGEGTWARVTTGSGTLSDATPGDGAATYTFPGNGEASVTLAFNYTTVDAGNSETINFDVDGGNEGTGEDPDLVVALSGLRITDGSGNALSIPEQIAGKPSDEAPGAISLALQAVRASDSDPSLCEPYFPDTGDVDVELGAECTDPDTCAGQQLEVTNNGNTSALATSDDNGGAGTAAYTPVTLRFGPNAEAPLVLEYDDAGRVQLHARYNPIDDGTGTPPVVQYVVGASNAFVVRPFGFEVSVAGDDNTTGAGGTVLAVAGDDVDTTVRAVTWQAADDGDDDGRPDAGADLSGNAATPNFGNEATPETVTLAPAVAAPAGGSDGVLSAPVFSSFASGSETHGVSWSEVGHVHMDAAITDGSYLGGGDATGRADTVGRFIPADFNVAVADDGDLDAACAATFTYTGQPAGYATGMEPRLTITARNRAGTTTTNYRGAYAKMTAADVDVTGPSQDGTEIGRAGNPVAVASSINTGTLVANGDGTLTHTFASTDRFTYTKVDNARIDPFTPDLDLAVTGADDGEAAADPAVVPLTVEPAATHDIRFGRLAVDGAIGSERAPIDQPVRAEYWLNGTWQAHGADGCTQLTLAGELQLANTSGTVNGDQTIAVGGGTTDLATNTPDPAGLVGGSTVLTFAAPGAGNTGWVDTTATLGGALPWLRHDWDDADGAGDGPYDDLPVGRVTFGIYAGSPNWIHFRRAR